MQSQSPQRPDLLCDTRWTGYTGIARFGDNVLRRLRGMTGLPAGCRLFHPLDPIWLSRVISVLQPRVYFSPGFNPPLWSKRPFVFVIHDLNYVHCRENSDVVRRAYFELVVRPACRRAARILTVSEFSRSQILEWARVPPEHVVNVGAGVDAGFTVEGPRYDPGYPYVLYVGNRLPHKNLPRLFEAFSIAGTGCKLVLTGHADKSTLEHARKFRIEDDLIFAGEVPNQSLPSLYRGARAVVLPSLFEGFGLPVLEAMACGVPVLASNGTSLPEVTGGGGLLVDPERVDEIADGLMRLLNNEALRKALTEEGLRQAARFSWERTVHVIESVLVAIN